MSKITFYDMQFPSDIAYGASGGPEFFTDIVTSSSGFEHRSSNWQFPRQRYNLVPAIKTKEQLDQILRFFYLVKGKAIAFRFKDWVDYNLSKQEIAVADGERQEFQLIKTYQYGDYKMVRNITKPVKNACKIYVNEQLVKVKIDENTGIIKFAEAPEEGSVIKAEGEFDVKVRFDIDHLLTSIEDYGAYSHQEIPLIEVK
jgi:uncharacterized protein (TIGR02217 family)